MQVWKWVLKLFIEGSNKPTHFGGGGVADSDSPGLFNKREHKNIYNIYGEV